MVNTFQARKKVEREYYQSLRTVATRVQSIIDKYYNILDPTSVNKVVIELYRYSETLEPWAQRLARRMMGQVNSYNLQDWTKVSEMLGKAFKRGYAKKDGIYRIATNLQNEQVKYIKTLPQKAAARVQALSRKQITEGLRHEELAARIMKSYDIVEFRARCLARTEVAKANTALTAGRAQSVGCTHFIWRTAGDEIVRESHKELNGKVCSFANPPYIPGEGAHLPGDVFNCRCWIEPIISTQEKAEK